MVPAPKKVKKLTRKAVQDVADYGVFRVQRQQYEEVARDVFVYECPDWCNVIAETDDGNVVFVWQYRFGTDAVALEVPCGVVDPGEEPIVAAARELREETGYEAPTLELLCAVEPNPALQGNRCFTYVARGAKLVGPTSFDEDEELEVVLVPKTELAALLDSGKVTHALVLGPLETYLRRFGERGVPAPGPSSTTSPSKT